MRRFLIFGAGYSARAFARLRPQDVAIRGTTRKPQNHERLRRAGIDPLSFDGEALTGEVRAALAEASHLVVSAAPTELGDPVLRAAGDALAEAAPKLRWIGYLSTVGVYGDHGGAWVDESSPTRPVSRRSVLRVAAEAAWLRVAERCGLKVAVLRLAGIYGPGRNAFVNLEKGTAKRLVKPGQVFNRIHVDDIASALWHLAEAELGGIFNVTDDEPAPPQDVVAYAAGLMGVAAPVETPFETAELSPMARSFYSENKRVLNGAIKRTGFTFTFPDYRSGLGRLWSDGTWRGEDGDAASPINMS
jgi:nucleoside-diphosphate-sugar epimerase